MRRPWLRRLLKVGLWTLAVVLVLALVAGGYGIWSVRRPFPSYDGEQTLAGLSAPVTVYRDQHGIPQVYAETVEDLFRAQGYLHAQDRFWEMDLRRHLTSGRLAEWFGPDQVETDTFLRTLGWRRVAEAEWRALPPEPRTYLEAYAEGVNAWIEATGGPAATGRKALQYRVLGLQNSGYEVEPWDPVDSLAWLKAMAWDLRGNLEQETERAELAAAGLTRDQVAELFPDYPYQEHAPILAGGQVVDGAFDPDTGEDPHGGSGGSLDNATGSPGKATGSVDGGAPGGPGSLLGGPGNSLGGGELGSNSWVVGGEHTESGAPILANDPHLGVSLPGIWYQVGLHCSCGYEVSGFSFSGVPGIVIGHNARIAWGFTNLGADVTDLYLERIDNERYEVDGGWRDLALREETIRVAGGDDVTIQVRETHRGPVLSDADEDLAELAEQHDADGISLAWTALTPGRTVEALFMLNEAREWDDFREAAAHFEVPAQNMVYADVDGNIGYQAPGKVPVRGRGDGRWPAPGWDSRYDWSGFVDFEALPHLFNPPSGMIVTANQAVIGPQYQPLLTHDWAYGYRSDRIQRLLDRALAAGPLTVSGMERIQFDNRNGFAPALVPALLAAAVEGDPAEAVALLRDWDFQQNQDSAAAAYFNVTWRHLLSLTFDELPEDWQPAGGGRWFQVMTELVAEPTSPWWDRTDTGAVETRDDLLGQALADAYQELSDAQGSDPGDWRWGELHTLELQDSTFGSSGIGLIETLFNRGPVEVAGGSAIVNATWWDASEGYEVTAAPSMRMVVEMSDLDDARWVQLTGNSGHPYHPNYTDQLEFWRTGLALRWPWDRPTIEAAATDTLTLSPTD